MVTLSFKDGDTDLPITTPLNGAVFIRSEGFCKDGAGAIMPGMQTAVWTDQGRVTKASFAGVPNVIVCYTYTSDDTPPVVTTREETLI